MNIIEFQRNVFCLPYLGSFSFILLKLTILRNNLLIKCPYFKGKCPYFEFWKVYTSHRYGEHSHHSRKLPVPLSVCTGFKLIRIYCHHLRPERVHMSLVSRAQVGDTAALGLPFCQAWLPGAEGWLPALDGAGRSSRPQPLQAWLPAFTSWLCSVPLLPGSALYESLHRIPPHHFTSEDTKAESNWVAFARSSRHLNLTQPYFPYL